ncbi:hypothetical protein HYH03_011704 [Edaphochlamys debaryana]|uniref:Uncharacterized protein n=1 Tax=Edaphochlamys debaryana TaxID=47281 RepID=A0A835XRL9_9CHLO|nr:hypothetical protein HYH03_011704 [Edaphochlamys debaryana]|eukprot:KAG2489902.1 hypothetical protein HYH03_011704 [Edaphochlamys debaryana]
MTPYGLRQIFKWYPIQNLLPSEAKWGGYFTIPPPPVTATPTTYTTIVPLPAVTTTPIFGCAGCAGCAKNDPRRGYNVGGIVLQVRAISSTNMVASCALTIKNFVGNVVVVDSGHFYASFAPLTTFAPGLFPTATTTGIPGAENATVTMTQKVGGTAPASNPLVYLACHFTTKKC